MKTPEKITVKARDGKGYEYNLPAIPDGFKNGAKLRACLKTALRKNADSPKECRRLVEEYTRIYEAERLETFKMTIEWTKSGAYPANPTVKVWMFTRTSGAYSVKKGNPQGANYDKASHAAYYAIHEDNEPNAIITRYMVENDTAIRKAGYSWVKPINPKAGKLPEMDTDMGRYSDLRYIFRELGMVTFAAEGKTWYTMEATSKH